MKNFYIILTIVTIFHIIIINIVIKKELPLIKSKNRVKIEYKVYSKVIKKKNLPIKKIKEIKKLKKKIQTTKKVKKIKKRVKLKENTSTTLSDQKENTSTTLSDQKENTSTTLSDQKENTSTTLSDQKEIVTQKVKNINPPLGGSGAPQKNEQEKIQSIKENYISKIIKLIKKNKKYPIRARRLRREGTTILILKISKTGVIEKLNIIKKSKYSILDKASIDSIKRIKRFPEFPKELNINSLEIKIPIKYILN